MTEALPSALRIPCILVSLTALCSCAGLSLPPQESFPSGETLAYCDLVYVPQPPPVILPPKPLLGVSLTEKEIDLPVPPCKDRTFPQITGVMSGSPAARAGLKKGDVILSVNGNLLCGDHGDIASPFIDLIGRMKTGSTVSLRILRDNQERSVDTELAEKAMLFQPEAEHPQIGRCPAGLSSRLETALRERNALSLLNGIRSGLERESHYVINPEEFYGGRPDPRRLKEVTYMIRHPLEAGAAARELSERIISKGTGGDSVRGLSLLIDIELPPSPAPAEITFPQLLRTMEDADTRVRRSLNRFTQREMDLLREKALHPWDEDQWNTFLDLSGKIDLKELLDALSPLYSFLSTGNLHILKEDLLSRFRDRKEAVLFEAETPAGKVIVGNRGPNIYKEDAALILDLGGDDLYLNNAGGTRPGMSVALVIDWEGDDRYLSGENFSQGAGLLGGGFLFDLSGNDTFHALDGSQGAGFFGIGLLYHGNGNADYKARSFSQGVGQVGIGSIRNGKGDTLYLCSEAGQGLGLFGGAGVLVDEAGNDYYQLGGLRPDFRDPSISTVSMGQGFGKGLLPEDEKKGAPGGMGMLIDREGDDTYVADYFAQGSSYFYGAGILEDLSGNDRYFSGRYAQGAGVHSSVGVLIDREGDDFYYASYGVAQGLGHDFGVGYLEDTQGDDRYFGGILVQGAATKGSLGILIDRQGRNHYSCKDKGQAFAGDRTGLGIFIDAEPAGDALSGHEKPASVRLGFKRSESEE